MRRTVDAATALPPQNRLVPEMRFPCYSYVPGRFPHPSHCRDEHISDSIQYPHQPLDPDRWIRNTHYCHGIDLFNHGYYWEAHEAWEGLWHRAGRKGTVADFIKGLIALAAAGVKAREGRPAGISRHAVRACELFGRTIGMVGPAPNRFLGQHISSLIKQATALAKTPERIVNSDSASVVVVMPFRLSTEPPRNLEDSAKSR